MTIHLSHIVRFIVFEVVVCTIAAFAGSEGELPGALKTYLTFIVLNICGLVYLIGLHFGWWTPFNVVW